MNSPEFTTNSIVQTQLENHYQHKALDNLLKAMFGNDVPDKKKLWERLAFYNFVQRVMDYRIQERPTLQDFDHGWEVFVEVVKELKPTDVIFIGVEAATSFERMMDKLGLKRSDRILHEKIGDVGPRSAFIEIDGHKTEISFVKHSSAMFSPAAWHSFLNSRHGDAIHFLQKI